MCIQWWPDGGDLNTSGPLSSFVLRIIRNLNFIEPSVSTILWVLPNHSILVNFDNHQVWGFPMDGNAPECIEVHSLEIL